MIRIDISPRDAMPYISTASAKRLQEIDLNNQFHAIDCFLMCNGSACTLTILVHRLTPDSYTTIYSRETEIPLAVFQSLARRAIDNVVLVKPDSTISINELAQQKGHELNLFREQLELEMQEIDYSKLNSAGITKKDEETIDKFCNELKQKCNFDIPIFSSTKWKE